ncbi:MAG TPA: hypothetical protein VD757_01095, partial [Candidatus Nitrosocosmicus sp.]|nr:hypothetical protein [Candidatus Nitrosocosmicus sp.]
MKAIFVSGIILLILISPLFNGLFFSLEMYVFFTLILSLASGYFLLKLVNKEHMVFDKWLTGLNILLIFAYASSF